MSLLPVINNMLVVLVVFLWLGSDKVQSDARTIITYELEIKTSNKAWSGTMDDLGFQLVGDLNGKTMSTPWKVESGYGSKFGRGRTDKVEIVSDVIGDLVDVRVRLQVKGLKVLTDRWTCEYIKVKVGGTVYKAFFDQVFDKDNEVKTPKSIQLVSCRSGFEKVVRNGRDVCRDRDECLETCEDSNQDLSQETYELEIKTSNKDWSGTFDDLAFQLVGDLNGITMYTPWKVESGSGSKFGRGRTDKVEIVSDDIGDLVDVRVRLQLTGFKVVTDRWTCEYIKVKVGGTVYKAFFDQVFDKDKEVKTQKSIQLVSCRSGFEKDVLNGRDVCRDRDECLETCKDSNQDCRNYEGGYFCFCKGGYQMIGDYCEDINECYDLAKPPCSRYNNSMCVNNRGGYTCNCKPGFRGNPCEDIDECKEAAQNMADSGINKEMCQQICRNTEGGFRCECDRGFKLAPNGFSCIEAIDCGGRKNPCNITTSQCFDVTGKYECLCRPGYTPSGQPYVCKARECEPVPVHDDRLVVSPPDCLLPGSKSFGDRCQFTCRPGYELHARSAKELACDEHGKWSATDQQRMFQPTCIPTLCPPVELNERVSVIPDACWKTGIQHGGKCYFYCGNGFQMVGPKNTTCHDRVYLTNSSLVNCYRVPKIECPADVKVSLPTDSKTVQLGDAFRGAISNMDDTQISSRPEHVSAEYAFSVGNTLVNFIATNEVGVQVSCNFLVQVVDDTPPVVKFCPRDLDYVAKLSETVLVSWQEPVFADNVGIQSVRSNMRNNQHYSPTSFVVTYEAFDVSNNRAKCWFRVNIKALWCDFSTFAGGDQAIQKACVSMLHGAAFCTAQCPQNKTFHFADKSSPLPNTWRCKEGVLIGTDRVPDCVDFTDKKDQCAEGFIETKHYKTLRQVCGKCPRGTFYTLPSNATARCQPCPRDSYQDEEGSMMCKPCPLGRGTNEGRSIGVHQCHELCPPGTRSWTGFSGQSYDDCQACPIGHYADKFGSTTCSACPPGTTTRKPGSTSRESCHEVPPSLFFLPSDSATITEGDSLTFSCLSKKQPSPKFFWSASYPQENQSGRHQVRIADVADEDDSSGIRFTIREATVSDTAQYICIAVDQSKVEERAYFNLRVVGRQA